MTDADLRLEPLIAPERLDGPDAAPFRRMVELNNIVCRHDTGHDGLAQEVEDLWGLWRDTADWQRLGIAAWAGDELVGVSTFTVSTQPGTATAEYDLIVDPDRWGEGAETALVDASEAEARRRGLRSLQTWTLHRADAPGERMQPSTGWGSIPADRHAALLHARGYALEQVERTSAFDLHGSFDRVERMLADAVSDMGDGYDRVHWTGATPDAYLEAFAYAISRMSTDAPQGGLDVEEQHWDADRVRRRDARQAAQGLTTSVAAVVHRATGAIVAFNELAIGADRTAATWQYGTLVLSEHRGRRLGTVVKCDNLLRWRTIAPESPRITTFNAEENRPMLSINEALGFFAVSWAGAWKKVLD
ncbi:GNAT family N-acetyltransferase [Microbacterium sp. NPDC091313]